jgi:(2R)-sulfolactate sulfo-lyase subunit alpha
VTRGRPTRCPASIISLTEADACPENPATIEGEARYIPFSPDPRRRRRRDIERIEGHMIHFLVHDKKDTVGVIVVEGVKAGQELTGWLMEDDSTVKLKALNDIPIGHKLATRPIGKGDTVIKYGFDIGKAVAEIKLGEHAHVHNIKTKRW